MYKHPLFGAACFPLLLSSLFAQGIEVTPSAGITKTIGDGSEYWKLGYNVGYAFHK